MDLAKILSVDDSSKKMKRIGRGPGSGHGKTSTKGHKGQKARSGHGARIRPGFEGGQMPLYRRLPKRGFIHDGKIVWNVINVGQLGIFEEGAIVTPESLEEKGLVKNVKDGVKILGDGELKLPLTLRVHAISESARQKVEKARGKIELIGQSTPTKNKV